MKIKIEKRKVGRTGGSLSLNLTKFFKKMGIKSGEFVWVFTDGEKIIISKAKPNSLKLLNISDDVWRSFLATLVEEYGEEVIMDRNKIKEFVEEALINYVKKKKSFWDKVVFRI